MILLHPQTQHLIKTRLESMAHGLLLTGAEGAGKAHAARYIAMHKLGLESLAALKTYPYLEVLQPQNSTISIEHIRNLQKFLQLKTPGKQAIRRIVIIEDAHLMTVEAQNALLKSLEEPPADTVIILTAPLTQKLKSTIYSRVEQIPILPIDKAQAVTYFSAQFKEPDIVKAYFISGGRAGLLHALLHAEDHALLTQIQIAKQVLGSPLFERLAKVDELTKQKENVALFLQACKLICTTALRSATQKAQEKQARRWHTSLSAVHRAEAALTHNPNLKLLLTDLLLNM